MATYTFLGGASFDDPNNWYNVTAGKPDDGVPGTDDTIGGSTAEIPAAGETVANAEGSTSKPVEISGGLTITGEGSDLWLLFGGNFSIGAIEGGYIVMSNGTTVTAGSVDLNQPNNTGLSLDGTSSLTVTGSVVAQGDNIDTSGTFNVDGGVSVTNATLEIDGGVATIGGALTLDSGSYLDLYQGSATVGSLSVVGSAVQVGSSSAATLKVTGDATVSSGGLSVLAGSTLTVAKTLTLGSSGLGYLTVASGGALIVDGNFDMAENDGSTSTATIDLTVHGLWQIGIGGTATATITQSATNKALGGITLGVQATGNGTLTVSGANTVLSVTGDVVIGEAGAGTLNVQNGAIVDAAASDVTVGEEGTVTDMATITGENSQFETGSLTVGAASSKATVKVSSGGDLEIASDLALGEQAGSKGTLNVTDAGSEVSVGGDATLGEQGSGTLTMMTGGAMSVAGAMTLGEDKGSSGKMTLSDATLSITGNLNIGEAGSGSAIVQLGSVLKSKAIDLGGALGASGSLTISGAGTSVTTGETTIGAGGAGTLKVNSGGLLTTNGDAIIGSVALGAIVSASLDTGGEWLVNGELDVGDSGAGTLSIAGKKTLVTVDGDMTIGVAAGGTVTLGSTAASSSAQLTWKNVLAVGQGGKGTLTINAGDSVSALDGGAGQMVIGGDVGSAGKVSLAGTGASLTGASLFVGGAASGSLSISAGASADFIDAQISATGKVTDAGALSISGALGGSGSVQISGAGQFTLGGSDSTVGIDFVSGGSNERLDLTAAHLPGVEIQGFGANDTIDVSGLSHSDTIGVSYKGAVATVRFLQAGKTVGSLRFAMKAGQGAFHFDAADGALTFAPTQAAYETALSALDLGGQAALYALPLDVLLANSAGVAYPTLAALDPFIGDLMLAGHYGGAFLSTHVFP